MNEEFITFYGTLPQNAAKRFQSSRAVRDRSIWPFIRLREENLSSTRDYKRVLAHFRILIAAEVKRLNIEFFPPTLCLSEQTTCRTPIHTIIHFRNYEWKILEASISICINNNNLSIYLLTLSKLKHLCFSSLFVCFQSCEFFCHVNVTIYEYTWVWIYDWVWKFISICTSHES